ncbi:MAG TPA: F0F1 ATP synthase subunit A [Gemmatimonadaceae bacterium]|nr:F0F1 ATP synthase subunit A [Gemmatimonadaceae bacterium]
MNVRLFALSMAMLLVAPVHAQEAKGQPVDIITPHITDSHELETPFGSIHLPRWEPVQIGGLTVDLSPTKHVVMLTIAATLCLLLLIPAGVANAKRASGQHASKGWAGTIEAIVLYLRNEVILPNVGPHGDAYVPFALTLFFFILFANLLGLIPYGSTATGNISVTATLAIITFLVVEGASIKALGWRYIWTIVFVPPKDMPMLLKPVMIAIMTPVELVSKFTKPFALAIRLFANMTAGHIVLLALISLIFTFGKWLIVPGPVALGIAINMLELFVAFLQAFIFTLLASVFIGLGRAEAH